MRRSNTRNLFFVDSDQFQPKPPKEVGRFPRSKSVNSMQDPALYKSMEAQLAALEVEVAALKRKLKLLEETNDRWGVRYSRRMAIITNFWIGAVLFGSSFLAHMQTRKSKLIQQVVVPGIKSTEPIGAILYDGASRGLKRSWMFLFASFLLARSVAWKRIVGIAFSSLCSVYLAFYVRFLPWPNYLNLFANLLYITAAFNTTNPDKAPTFEDFLTSF